MTPPHRYLVVDDDETFAERLARALEDQGATEAHAAFTHDDALALLDTFTPTRATLDLRMPDGSGLALLEELVARVPGIEVLMLTGYGSIATAVDAVHLGAVSLVQKPVSLDGILTAFERAHTPPLTPEDPDYQAPSLARVEWDHIQRVLSDCGGNISQASRVLGMHRRTLQRKLQQYPPKH